ncbi:T9SS type A sorting domain-containing protein [Pontibacter korlensis]|uniref:Secretion system C-terminal sorting domain-containing protein n=1 Tax=Pontibacter korlensis TaxID=400092 RepID=A0A0E3ZI09_9BACT|nr:T9SS type A sorting domain-containing protein [Pontibacter korlensis]AKD04810.1 hypothetical protein PKOR_19040 [Pontibacter korlensis]
MNGSGNYGFMLTATDGDLAATKTSDEFRIKIWDKNNGDAVVYDKELGISDDADPITSLGGGSIVIHTPNVKTASSKSSVATSTIVPDALETPKYLNYPNPYNDKTNISFSMEKEQSFSLEVFDVNGASVRKFDVGVAEAGKLYEYEFAAGSLPEGVYFARLVTSSGVKTIKMVLRR